MTRPRHILAPTDFSESSNAAGLYASMLAEAFDATLHVLHVIPDPLERGWAVEVADLPHLLERREHAVKEQLEDTMSAEERVGLRAQFVVETGAPTAKILEYARNTGVDLIVMGTHGRSAMERVLVGSVTQQVLHHAPCPVVSV